jgi:hypothetical protein
MSPVESVTLRTWGTHLGACLVNANAALRDNCICPERGHGRLSSSSARHRRRVVDPSDPPGAVNVASPTAAASTTHAAASASASAHAPDGPVALLASVVIRKLRVDHRLETECTLGRGCVSGLRVGKCRACRDPLGSALGRRKRGVLGWSRGGSRGVSGYSQRDDEVHDAPEHIREYARTHSRAPVHHRAC